MSEKHSPGPWIACGAQRGGCKCGLIWSTTDDVVVAEVTREDDSHKKTDEQFYANAALIASAPQLAADLDAANARAFRHAEDAGRDSAALYVALADLDAANKRIGEMEAQIEQLTGRLQRSREEESEAKAHVRRLLARAEKGTTNG